MTFANSYYFLLLLLLIPYIIWYFFNRKKADAALKVSDTHAYLFAPKTWKNHLIDLPFFLRIITFIMIVIVLARPQTSNSWRNSETEGIDIMLALDISTSMLSEDLRPNRIEAAKNVAASFIAGRPNDNIGLVIFASQSFTQCPMTTDHSVLLNLFRNVNCSLAQRGIIEDGTAIGMGLANAVSRLKNSHAKSKVVILLTDGSNNSGDISPATAAEIARNFGVRVYTIGVGTNGSAPYPMPVAGGVQYMNIPVEIDTQTLENIANTTGGKFYRATNTRSLENIYNDIDKLEKTKLKVKQFSKRYEAYQLFAFIGLISLLAEVLLRFTVFKKIP